MSYMSGIMVGWALGKGLRRIAARGGVFPSRSVTGHGERATENSRLGLLHGDFWGTNPPLSRWLTRSRGGAATTRRRFQEMKRWRRR